MPARVSAKKTAPGQKKETGVDKKRRIANNRKAKQVAQSYIIPGLALLLLGLVALFFYLYGFGGIAKKLTQAK